MSSKNQRIVSGVNMVKSVEPPSEPALKDELHDHVITAVENYDKLCFDEDGNLAREHNGAVLDTQEIKYAAYMDNPMDDDEPYSLSDSMVDNGGKFYIGDTRYPEPRRYIFNSYRQAKHQATNHAAALDLYEGGKVIAFIPNDRFLQFIVYPDHATH